MTRSEPRLVTIAEASRLLTAVGDVVERSTLSRYVDEYAAALPKQKLAGQRGTFVDVHALATHRSDNVRLSISDAVRSALRSALPEVGGDLPPPPAVPVSASAFLREPSLPGQSAAQARKLNAEAEKREIELAVMKRALVPVSDIARAADTAVGDMSAAFESTLSHQSDVLASRLGCTKAEARAALRESLAEFRRQLAQIWRDQIAALAAPAKEEPAAPA
jgi:hypothetical protein